MANDVAERRDEVATTTGGSSSSSSSPSPAWERAARLEDLVGDGPFAISAGGTELVALRSGPGRSLRVFEGRCPHQGALLGEGEIEGNAVVCRNHRWKFDRETGQRIGGRQCLMPCPSREQGDELFVDVRALREKLNAPPPQKEASKPRRLKDVPGPKGLPFVGNTLEIDIKRLHLQVEQWARQYGKLYRLRLGPREALVISDPDLGEPIFRARPDTYRRTSQVETVFGEMAIGGVFSAEGEAWRAQRRLAVDALAAKHLRGFYPTLEIVATRLVHRWEKAADEGRVLDIAEELKRFTVDVTTALVFGHDMNTLEKGDEDEDIIQRHLALVFPAFNRRLNALIPYWRFIRLPQDRRLDRSIAALRDWIRELVVAARVRLAKKETTPANFLEAMIVARDTEGKPFSDEVIFGNALTMLLAGEDTTAYTLAWAVHHLCEDRRATAMLRAEIAKVLGEEQVPHNIEQAGQLAYATAVANESMRLRPVAPTFFFEPLRDVVIGDVAVPKGTMILYLSRPPVLENTNFGEAAAFIPERWMGGWTGGAHDPSANVPFGSGPRICPGRSLAILEMRIVLAALYRNFDVERVGRAEDVEERTAFTMVPVGLRVLLRRRRSVSR